MKQIFSCYHCISLLLVWIWLSIQFVTSFVPHHAMLHHQSQHAHQARLPFFMARSNDDRQDDDDDDDDEDEALALKDDDWRAFRAKLVMGEKATETKDSGSTKVEGDLDGIGSLFGENFALESNSTVTTTTDFTPLDPSQWAYDTGDVIEQGMVILGGVEQTFGFGLRQQYFHKAAILVLDHGNTFTKGIILNRPTDLVLEDDVNDGKKWRVWFGGDVEGLNARHPDITCIHSLKSEMAIKASIPIMKDIQWTTFHNAKKLVKAGVADVRDFWVFVGYAGWGPGQLAGELTRNSWYMVATDSQTLLQELARNGEGADPRDAGLDTWSLLMKMIGRKSTAEKYSRTFDDLMLKEWAFSHLLSSASGGGGGRQQRDPQDFNTNPELVETLIRRATEASRDSMVGTFLRASSAERSPFLLENQDFHKSVVLILSDDVSASVGVVLNRPSNKGLDIKVADRSTGGRKVVTIPMRYGGQYAVKGQETLLWLHCNQKLRDMKVGSPVGVPQQNGIWKCTSQDVVTALSQGYANAEDFIVVSGVSVWEKNIAQGMNGIEGEIDLEKYELIPKACRDNVWVTLLSQQQVLSESNFKQSLAISEKAWSFAADGKKETIETTKQSRQIPILGLGENFDEDDDSLVFKSDTKVSKLSDDALRSWCATFLLGRPDVGIGS